MPTTTRLGWAVFCAFAFGAADLVAQCPDGTPPPCLAGRTTPARAPRPRATIRQDPPGQPRLTATYSGVQLKVVLRELGELLHRTMISSAAAETTLITARVEGRRWDEALGAIFRARGLTGEETPDGILTVTLMTEQPPAMYVFQPRRVASELAELLRPKLAAGSRLLVDSAANRLVFFIDPRDKTDYRELMRLLATPPEPRP